MLPVTAKEVCPGIGAVRVLTDANQPQSVMLCG